MNFVFSKHALEQMELRGISKTLVEQIVEKPLLTKEEDGLKIYQSIIDDYLFRIFVNENKDPKLIITVYKTSKIKKYNEG
jgi:Domain of unknown function (DUF4258)